MYTARSTNELLDSDDELLDDDTPRLLELLLELLMPSEDELLLDDMPTLFQPSIFLTMSKKPAAISSHSLWDLRLHRLLLS